MKPKTIDATVPRKLQIWGNIFVSMYSWWLQDSKNFGHCHLLRTTCSLQKLHNIVQVGLWIWNLNFSDDTFWWKFWQSSLQSFYFILKGGINQSMASLECWRRQVYSLRCQNVTSNRQFLFPSSHLRPTVVTRKSEKGREAALTGGLLVAYWYATITPQTTLVFKSGRRNNTYTSKICVLSWRIHGSVRSRFKNHD
jgi:hypothetical protein